ncbi:MAG TPA: hypothetical protein VK177_02455 [Flavobacteriales bacterium]|nr:hypothetical protein [Flavobacteriales bacterium]
MISKLACLLLLAGMCFNALGSPTGDSIKITMNWLRLSDTATFRHLKPGDSLPNIYFYDTSGKKVPADSLLKGKPIMFITGTYSCPSFRDNAKRIKKKIRKEKDTYDIYYIYLFEAHPVTWSPYGKEMNNLEVNRKKNINLLQQKTIPERISAAVKANHDFKLNANILVDSEKNSFYRTVLSSPNGYMVFSPTGILREQRIWFYKKKVKTKKKEDQDISF